jgi:hypothetical protein
MRNTLLSTVIAAVLLWGCGTAFAKAGGKGKGGDEKGKQASTAGETKASEDKAVRKGAGKRKVRAAETDAGKTKGKGKSEAKVKATRKGKAEEKKGLKRAGKGHQQQLAAFERQMRREEGKHNRRAARLQRLLTLANEKGDPKIIERVKKLMDKEQQRYDRKLRRSQDRRQKMLQLGEDGLEARPADADRKGPGRAKPKTKKSKERSEDAEEAAEKAKEAAEDAAEKAEEAKEKAEEGEQ